jgi:hypothetical protein
MSDEILRTLQVLSAPGQVIEVRAITDDGIASGYFDDPALLAAAVEPLDSLPTVQGIYVTLNEVTPALLSRRANRIKPRLGKKDATTADTDILRRRWFPVDIDPARPSGVSSTDAEHQAAIETAGRIADHLAGLGWPAPVIADSGNGAHLLYRIDLPNDDRSRNLVRRCLEVLATLFDDSTTSIDTANHNAARIWKLYGTMSRKGDHTTDRPHRRSRLLTVPEERKVVPDHLLEALASTLPQTPPGKKNGHAIDLPGWLRDHGIGIAREKPYQGGTLYVLEECPFSGAHRDGAFAIQFPNGAIHAGCQHTSCGGGSQRWQELKEKYEESKRSGKERSPAEGTQPHTRSPGPGSRQDPSGTLRSRQKADGTPGSPERSQDAERPQFPDEIPGRTKALEILQHGDPKHAMLQAFALDHEGDSAVAECLILSLASRFVANTNGLHVSVTGESGKGKSHAFSTLLRQIPPRFRLEGAMSNKALFYLEDLQAGSVIVLDDRALSEEMAEILKGVTTSFRTPFLYRTVSKDRKAQVCTIPERCVWWVAKVEGAGDDQVFNRMLTCWIDDSEEQDARVLARVLAREGSVPDTAEEERPEVLACQAMWDLIGQHPFHVVIPFAGKIRFRTAGNRRNPEMLLDLVKANCVLCSQQRHQERSGSLTCLEATREDFAEAARLYQLLNGIAGGQETKLTRRESDLIEVIQHLGQREFTIPELQKATGWSSGNLHKYLHGHLTRGRLYTGLMEKCPAIAYTDRTVVTEGEGCLSMKRRTNAYTFDPDLYRSWNSGGGVWLDDDPDTTSTDFNNTSTPVEVLNNELKGSDLRNNESSTNKCAATEDHFNKKQDTQDADDTNVHAGSCIPDPEDVEVNDTNPGYFGNKGRKSPEIDPITLQPSLQQDPLCGSVEGKRHHHPDPSVRINPLDYKPLEVPDHTYCRLCGNSWTHYVERLTEERKRRPKDQWQPYQICKRCYARAKKRAQQSATILPGTCDPARMERLTSIVSRCTICDLDAAVYIDRSTGIKLCETCYQRIAAQQEHGQVTG